MAILRYQRGSSPPPAPPPPPPPPSPPPPEIGARLRGGPYTSEANFDTNMVIILAALLCALICALGINSIVRCALRCGRRISLDAPPAARMRAPGLKRSALRRIPVVLYGSSGANIPATDCPICLGEFTGGEEVRILPRCNHGFHMKCIDTWLLSHSSCPTCRQCLPENLPDMDPGGIRPPGNATPVNGGDVSVVVEEVS